eukprot:7538786-Lingulodinium_polyedra.AAC.1
MRPPLHTVWMSATAEPMRPGCNPADIVACLKVRLRKQLTDAVLWDAFLKEILRDGVDGVYEVVPVKDIRAE